MRRLGRRAKTSKAKKAVEPAADEPEYTGPPSPRAIPYVEPWEGSSHPEWFEKIDAWVFAPVRHLFFPPPPSLYAEWPSAAKERNLFEALTLREVDVARIHEIFRLIDQDSSGRIEVWELLEFIKQPRTRFTKRVFACFDEDGSNSVDFREFVIGLWNYCTLGKAALVMFAFDLYDADSSGEIEPREIDRMLRELYGGKGQSEKARALAERLIARADERAQRMTIRYATGGTKRALRATDAIIDVEEFGLFVRTNPMVLAPAFHFQMRLREHVCGEAFWRARSRARLKLQRGPKERTMKSIFFRGIRPSPPRLYGVMQVLQTHVSFEARGALEKALLDAQAEDADSNSGGSSSESDDASEAGAAHDASQIGAEGLPNAAPQGLGADTERAEALVRKGLAKGSRRWRAGVSALENGVDAVARAFGFGGKRKRAPRAPEGSAVLDKSAREELRAQLRDRAERRPRSRLLVWNRGKSGSQSAGDELDELPIGRDYTEQELREQRMRIRKSFRKQAREARRSAEREARRSADEARRSADEQRGTQDTEFGEPGTADELRARIQLGMTGSLTQRRARREGMSNLRDNVDQMKDKYSGLGARRPKPANIPSRAASVRSAYVPLGKRSAAAPSEGEAAAAGRGASAKSPSKRPSSAPPRVGEPERLAPGQKLEPLQTPAKKKKKKKQRQSNRIAAAESEASDAAAGIATSPDPATTPSSTRASIDGLTAGQRGLSTNWNRTESRASKDG